MHSPSQVGVLDQFAIRIPLQYHLFFVEERLRNILHSNSKLEFDETRKNYIQLLYDEKIKVINEWQTFIPSFYNVS
jgi:hypothetical protein